MPLRPRRPGRPATAALAASAAALLVIPLLAGCGAVQKAMDCTRAAGSVVDAVDKLQRAAGHALDDPQQARQALDSVEQNLRKVGDDTGDPDLAKAIHTMNKGITHARRALDRNQVPDIQPIADGAGDMAEICTPG
ncbi:hypothetical protein [Streptomyces sioyaensis]|uniref:hypothetical protein n=1 Tax=Streptomyces sioyaensis TaxID=67364 RepID=UPI00379A106E